MKSILLFIVTLITFSAYSQVISFPDANFKTLLLSASPTTTVAKNFSGANFKIDANNNGEIEVVEAQQVKALEVKYEPLITSIVGIKNFTNLEYLETAYLQTAILDVSGMVSLKTFMSISCAVYTINMAGCTSIEDVTFMSIPATNIDFSPLTNLKNVMCMAFRLVAIDLHNNSMLQTLRCGITDPASPFPYINIQNGSTETFLDLPCLPPTSIVCCDEADLPKVYEERRNCGSYIATVRTNCNLKTDDFQKNISSIYPNPVIDEINILGLKGVSKVEIFDINGRCVLASEYVVDNKVNVRDLSSGIYIAKLHSDENISTVKFVKQLQ